MGRPNRHTAVEIADRRTRVADLYVRGHTQSDIAERLGTTQPVVSKDLTAIQKEWRAQRSLDAEKLHELKLLELERIDRREREAWEAWERSKLPTETRKVGKVDSVERTEITTVTSAGNPRFLEIVAGCVDQRCKICGLFAAEKQSFELPAVSEDDGDLTPQQGRTEFDALFVALRVRSRESKAATGDEGDAQSAAETEPGGVPLPTSD